MTTHSDYSDHRIDDDNQLIPSVSISHLLQQRNAVLERLAQAVELLRETEALAKEAHIGIPDITVSDGGNDRKYVVGGFTNSDLDCFFQQSVDGPAWSYLLDQSGLRSLMLAKRRKAFNDQLLNKEVPSLTRENITDTFSLMYQRRGLMLDEGIIDCFKSLSWSYKTNNPVKFGKRIIRSVLDVHGNYWFASRHAADTLDDLLRVFHIADDKPEADHRFGAYQLIDTALKSSGSFPKHAENEYFDIKLFKNGNGHILFKRPDLVESLNRIVARHYPGALPPSR